MVSITNFSLAVMDGSLVTEGFSDTLFNFKKLTRAGYKPLIMVANPHPTKLAITLGNG